MEHHFYIGSFLTSFMRCHDYYNITFTKNISYINFIFMFGGNLYH